MLDLQSFLEGHISEIIQIKRPVKLEHVGALVGQAEDTILIENIEGYPDFKIIDQIFYNRKAQARVLGCNPADVVKQLSKIIQTGPKKLKIIESGPCQDQVFTEEEIDLNKLPIVTHTELDAYPYTTGFAIHKDLETGSYNAMFPRCGVLSKNEMVTSYVTPTANNYFARYKAAGKKMPQAVVIGAHPAWELELCILIHITTGGSLSFLKQSPGMRVIWLNVRAVIFWYRQMHP
jgi:2,5-furandicarboxylate decarboxylase 1